MQLTTKIDAVVLAGGSNAPDVAAHTGAAFRALTPLAGRPLFLYVADALAACESVRRVLVVGPVPQGEHYTAVPPGHSLLDNLTRGLDALGANSAPVLIVTADVPFLTPEALDDFLAQAVPLNADFAYAIVPLGTCKARFPTLRRTTLKLHEGEFTGGNLMLINPTFVRDNKAAIGDAYAARKRPLRLAKMLGMGLLGRVLLSQTVSPHLLTVAQLEAGVSRLLGAGASARAVVSNYAEVGTDIDDLASLAAAETLMTRQ